MYDDVKQAVTPLRMLFWGGLLCIFDITFKTSTNGNGFQFDVLNDALGMILIAIGVSRLGTASVDARYAHAMKFVQVIAVLGVLDAIREHFILRLSPAADFGLAVFGFASLVAVVVYCVAMRWFCESAGMERAAMSWRFTTRLFVIVYLIPTGLFYLANAGALLAGESYNVDLGAAGVLLFLALVIPLVHLFISLSRMKRAAAAL